MDIVIGMGIITTTIIIGTEAVTIITTRSVITITTTVTGTAIGIGTETMIAAIAADKELAES